MTTHPVVRAIGVSHTACKERGVSTKSSISQLECIFIFIMYQVYIRYELCIYYNRVAKQGSGTPPTFGLAPLLLETPSFTILLDISIGRDFGGPEGVKELPLRLFRKKDSQ